MSYFHPEMPSSSFCMDLMLMTSELQLLSRPLIFMEHPHFKALQCFPLRYPRITPNSIGPTHGQAPFHFPSNRIRPPALSSPRTLQPLRSSSCGNLKAFFPSVFPFLPYDPFVTKAKSFPECPCMSLTLRSHYENPHQASLCQGVSRLHAFPFLCLFQFILLGLTPGTTAEFPLSQSGIISAFFTTSCKSVH